MGSPRAPPEGDAVVAATSADQGEMSATFLMVSPSALSRFAKLTLADGGSENRIFHCHRNSPNKGNELFLSQALHALLLCTYVPMVQGRQHFTTWADLFTIGCASAFRYIRT